MPALIFVGGLAAAVAGLALVSVPVAVIVAGLLAAAAGVQLHRNAGGES